MENSNIESLEEMEILLTSDTIEGLEKLEKEFELELKQRLGDKVRILSSNKID